uniref:Uncharacterized protein n=1 Tax=Moniliophthora roreri TaxID=221103 RepID=A0A0W0FY56_MONRR
MSFLSGPRSSSGGLNNDKIEMAITELDTVTDFFNRMVSSVMSQQMHKHTIFGR